MPGDEGMSFVSGNRGPDSGPRRGVIGRSCRRPLRPADAPFILRNNHAHVCGLRIQKLDELGKMPAVPPPAARLYLPNGAVWELLELPSEKPPFQLRPPHVMLEPLPVVLHLLRNGRDDHVRECVSLKTSLFRLDRHGVIVRSQPD